FCDRFWVKQWDRTDAPITAKPRRSLRDKLSASVEMPLLCRAVDSLRAFPRLTPPVCQGIFYFTPSRRDAVVDLVEAIHYRRGIEQFRLGCLEIALKIDRDFANVKWAIKLVLDQTRAYAARGAYPFNVTLNVRFVHRSNCWLSPAFGEGHTCYIEILSRT